jgi:glucan phosphoethanolaminetransferase (alkaline phosphatase superfamily)
LHGSLLLLLLLLMMMMMMMMAMEKIQMIVPHEQARVRDRVVPLEQVQVARQYGRSRILAAAEDYLLTTPLRQHEPQRER